MPAVYSHPCQPLSGLVLSWTQQGATGLFPSCLLPACSSHQGSHEDIFTLQTVQMKGFGQESHSLICTEKARTEELRKGKGREDTEEKRLSETK